jgi:hypothetical protein
MWLQQGGNVRQSGPSLSYATAAEALFALAANQDGVLHTGAKDDPIRRLLYTAAEACHCLDQAQADQEAALLYAAEMRSLLELAVGVLEAQPLPVEGGTWDGYLLAHQARELLRSEPLVAGKALRHELQAVRVVARAATALATVQQEGSPERIRACEQALQRAVASLGAAPTVRSEAPPARATAHGAPNQPEQTAYRPPTQRFQGHGR